jgi:hypothetical protein
MINTYIKYYAKYKKTKRQLEKEGEIDDLIKKLDSCYLRYYELIYPRALSTPLGHTMDRHLYHKDDIPMRIKDDPDNQKVEGAWHNEKIMNDYVIYELRRNKSKFAEKLLQPKKVNKGYSLDDKDIIEVNDPQDNEIKNKFRNKVSAYKYENDIVYRYHNSSKKNMVDQYEEPEHVNVKYGVKIALAYDENKKLFVYTAYPLTVP